MDFPLTPPCWLAIAFCVMFATIGHAAVGHRILGIGKWKVSTNLSGETPSLSDSANSKFVDVKSHRISDRSTNLYEHDLTVSGGYHGQMSAGGVLVTPSDAVPALNFLGPVAARGPPSASEESTYPFDGAPLSLQIRLHDSSVSATRDAFCSGTDQMPVRSVIHGDPT
ncbi:MAG TPA: hypothetical protein VNL17_05940 [Verrucomicrobiae bacterium]|nr:hypothetical protein [Verrucomicrobiae bacterium]